MTKNETGLFILFGGFVFFFLGAILLDRGLMCAANIVIVVGMCVLLRISYMNLLQPFRSQGAALFSMGVVFCFMGYLFFGFVFEIIGTLLILKGKLSISRAIITKGIYKLFKFSGSI